MSSSPIILVLVPQAQRFHALVDVVRHALAPLAMATWRAAIIVAVA